MIRQTGILLMLLSCRSLLHANLLNIVQSLIRVHKHTLILFFLLLEAFAHVAMLAKLIKKMQVMLLLLTRNGTKLRLRLRRKPRRWDTIIWPIPVLCLTLRVLIYKMIVLGLKHALLVILLLHNVAEAWIFIRILRYVVVGYWTRATTPYATLGLLATKLTFVMRLLPLEFLNAVVDLLQLLFFLSQVTLATIFDTILAELGTLLLSVSLHLLRRCLN